MHSLTHCHAGGEHPKLGVFPYDQLDQVDDFYGELHLAIKGQVVHNTQQQHTGNAKKPGHNAGSDAARAAGATESGGESIFKTSDAHEIVQLVRDYIAAGKKSDEALKVSEHDALLFAFASAFAFLFGVGRVVNRM